MVESLIDKRDQSFDVLKGILILLVVIGHAIADSSLKIGGCCYNKIFNAIYLFHMPLFIFVSGFFANSITRYSFSEVVRKKAKRLILPWFIWASVAMAIWFSSREFISLDFHSREAFVQIGKALYRTYTQYLWFLPCVFVLSILYYPILKFLHLDEKKYMYIDVCILVIWFISLFFHSYFPFNYLGYLQISKQIVPFGMGLFYFFYQKRLDNFKALLFLIAILGSFLGFNVNGIWQCDYTYTAKMYNVVVLTIISFILLKFCCKQLEKVLVFNRIMCWIGQNSLGIYVLHMTCRTILNRFDLFPSSVDLYSVSILSAIYVAFSIVVIFSVKYLLKSKSYILGV